MLAGAISDTLAARVEVVSWPAAVKSCFCGGTTSIRADTTISGTYEHPWLLAYVPVIRPPKTAAKSCAFAHRHRVCLK